eukprot:4265592-Alexandrium_andersonii.AAC.1
MGSQLGQPRDFPHVLRLLQGLPLGLHDGWRLLQPHGPELGVRGPQRQRDREVPGQACGADSRPLEFRRWPDPRALPPGDQRRSVGRLEQRRRGSDRLGSGQRRAGALHCTLPPRRGRGIFALPSPSGE